MKMFTLKRCARMGLIFLGLGGSETKDDGISIVNKKIKSSPRLTINSYSVLLCMVVV